MQKVLLNLVTRAWFLWLLAVIINVLRDQRGALTVDQTWVIRFHDQLRLTYQQMDSKLRALLDPGMVHTDVQAEIDHHDRLGNVIANDVVVPFAQINPLNPVHSRRAVTLQSSEGSIRIADENSLRAMINPQDGYMRTLAAAMQRRSDKHIIDALTGSAQTTTITAGTGVPTYGTQAMPSARWITSIAGTTAISLTNIIAATEMLDKAGVPSGSSERVMLYSPGQTRDVMAITQASSSDFTRHRIHDTGTINGIEWEGFQWMMIPDVVDTDGSTALGRMLQIPAAGSRRCVAFHKSCIGLSVGREIQSKIQDISINTQSFNAWQVRAAMMMASVRVWEGGVAILDVKEN